MSENCNVLTIVVPCYNEQEVLNETTKELTIILKDQIEKKLVKEDSKILYVNDGSEDETWNIIEGLSRKNKFVTGIKFSRNFGHQNALIAGLTTASSYSDAMITIDADLQDDVSAIPDMIQKFLEGNDIVYGVRNNRTTDTWFKRKTAGCFYQIMKKMGVEMVSNHADYRLMSRRAVSGLLKYSERNLFLRGIVPLIGYPSTKVYYARKERYAGTSKYPLKKMIGFALDGITSFSVVPIKAIFFLGTLIVVLSLVLMLYTLVERIIGETMAGWSSLMISIWFLGGVQLIALSLIGEYVGKVFTEVKRRPRFEIQEDLYSKSFKKK